MSVCVLFMCVCGLYCSAYCEVAQCALRSGQTPPELKSFSSLAGFQAAPRDAGQCFRQGDTRPVPMPLPLSHLQRTLSAMTILLSVPRMPCKEGCTSQLQQNNCYHLRLGHLSHFFYSAVVEKLPAFSY